LCIKGRNQTERVRECCAEGDLWPRREELTGDWRKYHHEEPAFKCSSDQTQKNVTGRTLARGGERGIQGLVWRSERKRPHGRPKHRWEENIKMDVQGIALGYGVH
jgi:hypothetical protein